jgi:hypothetical protein
MQMKRRHRTRRALAIAVAAAPFLLPLSARAGELRVILEGEAGVRNDGNVRQIDTVDGVDPVQQDVARGALNLQLSYNVRRRFDLALGYSPSYERSLDDSSLAGTSHRLDLGLRGALTRRLAIDVRERLLSTPGLDLYTPVAIPESIAVAERGRQLFHSLDIGLHHELSRRTTLEAALTHSLRRFEETGLYDARTVGGRVGAGFHFSADRDFELTAGIERFAWENDREADVQTATAAYSQAFGRFTRLRLEAGSFYVEETRPARLLVPVTPDDPTPPAIDPGPIESKTGWRGGAQISQERRLFRWNLGYRHDIGAGYGVGRPVEADNGFFGVSTSFGRRLTVGLDGNGSRQRELQDLRTTAATPTTGANGDPLTEFAAGTLRASWSFAPALRLTAGYSRIWQRSSVRLFDDLSYDRYFVGFAFRLYQTGETPRAPGELGRPEPEEPTDADAKPVTP